MTLSCIQGFYEVLIHNYTPQAIEERNFLELKQAFIYSVFDSTLLFSHDKAFVRECKHDYDAQLLYRLLMTYFKPSTNGISAAAEILGYIANTRLGDSTWNRRVHDFILHWLDKSANMII